MESASLCRQSVQDAPEHFSEECSGASRQPITASLPGSVGVARRYLRRDWSTPFNDGVNKLASLKQTSYVK